MDWTAIGSITTSISAARDIAKGIAAMRDITLINEKTAALMEQLLKAQESLLAHNSMLLQLQNEHFEAREELRKLQETLSERGRYTLVELAPRQLAYRVNVAPQLSGTDDPGPSEPLHYACQPCFDKGIKAVLQGDYSLAIPKGLRCPVCKTIISEE